MTGIVRTSRRRVLAALLATFPLSATQGADIGVAVASNFRFAIEELAEAFETTTGHHLVLSVGATGKHYAQIRNGAPFDVFLAADRERPGQLEAAGIAVAGSRFTYAVGRLVLWSAQGGYAGSDDQVLHDGGFRHLAIANPRLAPYGRAARETLESLGLLDDLQGRLVYGENIAQTFQFVSSGAAELGFVALSQVSRPGAAAAGSFSWVVPASLHRPIEQQAVLIVAGEPAESLMAFLRGAAARRIIRNHGYETP